MLLPPRLTPMHGLTWVLSILTSRLWEGFLRHLRILRAPLGTGACLVCLDVGAVYADVLRVSILAQFVADFLDQAAFRPLPEPLVHRLPWAVPLRQVAPGRSASGDPEDAVQHLPGSPPRASFVAQLPLRKIGLQSLPLSVCQFVTSNYPLYIAHLIGNIRRYLTEILLVLFC